MRRRRAWLKERVEESQHAKITHDRQLPSCVLPPPTMAAAKAVQCHSLAYPDSLLLSRFTLPPQPTISYALFKPLPNALAPQDSIELARRSILSRNTSASFLESLLESVQLSPEPLLYIFKLTPHHSAPAAANLFATLDFPGLTRMSCSTSFAISDICYRRRDFILYTPDCLLVSPLSFCFPRFPA